MRVASSGCLFDWFEISIMVIISQFSRPMEDGQRIIEIVVNLHPNPDVMVAVTIRGDLEFPSLEADAVVGVDYPFLLFTEHVIEIFSLSKERMQIPLRRPVA